MTSSKWSCARCGKGGGVFLCRGCSEDFCLRHANEHRQELGKQMDELFVHHDQLRQSLSEQTTAPEGHSLIKQIDEWEKQSIAKIRQTSDDARRELLIYVNRHSEKLSQILASLTQQLIQARDEDDFIETDLKRWSSKIEQLKVDFLFSPHTATVQQDDLPFISKLNITGPSTVVSDRFQKPTKNEINVHLEHNDQTVTHVGPKNGDVSVFGQNDYSTGRHAISFLLEKLHENYQPWIFFGIISKDQQRTSYSSYKNPTAYGWAGQNDVYLNGILQQKVNDSIRDMQIHDVLQLMIDCDERKIRLINERTQSTHEISIDAKDCPLPWQFHLCFYYPADRVHILSLLE